MKGTLYFDGACEPVNPGGVASYGFILIVGKKKYVGWGIAETNSTNNVAEYWAIIKGLQRALELGITDIEIKGDSKLVVNQVAGRWRIKAAHLRPLVKKAKAVLNKFASWQIEWIPREENAEADRASRQPLKAISQYFEKLLPLL